VEAATLLLDVASLTEQEVQVGEMKQRLAAGGQTLTVPISRDQPVTISGDAATFSIVRVQLWRGTPALDAVGGVALTVESAFAGSQLQLLARLSRATEVTLEIYGSTPWYEKPVHLLTGKLTTTDSTEPSTLTVDLIQPSAPWLEYAAPAVDGRYIAYLRIAGQASTDGLPVAQFTVRNGQVVDAQPLPTPLTIVR